MILALDSAFDFPSVALFDGDSVMLRLGIKKNGHVAEMNLLIEKICDEAGINYKDLHAISLNIGPGSFTGLRVGTSIAKAMSIGLNIPIIAHSSTEILFNQTSNKNVLTMIDARNNNAYHQNHSSALDVVIWTSTDEALEMSPDVKEIVVNTESLYELMSSKIKKPILLVNINSAHQHALACKKFMEKRFVGAGELAPKYVLRPKITKRKKALY